MKKVITYGTFDLLHYGHINLLKRAKALGNYLIVGVTSDNYDKYRGKLNVSQSVIERIENVKATGLADEIIVEEYEGQKIDDIVGCKVDIFAIGSDWIGKFDYLKEYCQVVYLDRTKGISSTELRNNKHALIRFGIVGSGRIANRFIPESKYVSGISVEGVFGIHEDSAKAFFEKHQLAFYTINYSEFLEKIDAVYIASPHESHYQYAKQALLSGKHVLCEKPLVLSKDEASELFALAQLKRLVLMEAIKTAYCPGFLRLISLAKSGKIGEIKSVDAAFTKLVPPHVREMQSEHAGGSVTELATYPLFAIIKLLGNNFVDIHFTSCYKQGVDIFTKIDIVYPHAVASAKVGLGVKTEGDLIISGTRGYVYVPAPWWKTEYFELRFENLADTEKYYYKFSGDGLRYEIVEFLNRIGKEIYTNQDESTQIVNIIEMFKNKMVEITQI
ncbi:MAG: Gfo/Idh/MocA family oxidoreductase [Methanocorpusculum sp.]|uniref:Gfo/Idh/MocA family oxidoreductase n=1 Tax=Methanocorpusculum sp. TaxID=2058474 RepID=UPI002B1EF2E3|nr:Gfo/Idh/MocA family oxidoreductase [Methanocorpusculum sp.]MEA5086485.1 Gfo/Idh/MocA family oxidoreductase [Methanocorpusculum sp.]